jgi:hypothetical protein
MADDAVATTMSEHCAYCPSNATDLVGDCAYPHAPTINVFDRTAHHIAMLFDGPQLQPMAFNLDDLRQTQRHIAIVDFHPTPPRPIILTHCVQLK